MTEKWEELKGCSCSIRSSTAFNVAFNTNDDDDDSNNPEIREKGDYTTDSTTVYTRPAAIVNHHHQKSSHRIASLQKMDPSKIAGKYHMINQENFDEFLKALGMLN